MSDTNYIQFVLDGEIVTERSIDPQMSVLTYCRETLLKTGTHEGCAEGDCGACTIVLAELDINNNLVYQNVNACILLLPMLHGKALFTVESLASKEQLHPVQQAMVDFHASQCGFCSPGFVMSLFALYKRNKKPSRSEVSYALSGNLCRCTGYRPIIDAALHMHQYKTNQLDVEQHENNLKQQLISIQTADEKQFVADNSVAFYPESIEQLCQLKQQYPQAIIVAGNTDVGLWLNKQLKEIPQLLLIAQIKALNKIQQNDQGLTIGAAVKLSDAFQVMLKFYPNLLSLMRRFASLPICNAGTLVGNIANGSAIGDSMPILIALGASIRLRNVQGFRDVSLEDFYLGYQQSDLKPDEFIETVYIPVQTSSRHLYASYKISKRFDQDISAINMAFSISLDEDNRVEFCKIACGGMAAIPSRAKNVEQALIGKQWNQSHIDQAKAVLGEDFQPLDDLRASAEYRLLVAQNLLQRFYIETTQSNVAVNVYTMGASE